ncbi:MAG: AGE family epimerase/isomerase [Oscillospiraceae bacterium]|jgi:mannobiose 2-epimerase|nr:AGE family epimerase/isomerase [Oscillospiraceae bacterium]
MDLVDARFETLQSFAESDLHDRLLPWWMEHMPDDENGGFYGVVLPDNTPDKTADRFIVLFSRLVWTFSSAYRVTGRAVYKAYARRAYEYFVKCFYDQANGGFFTSVKYDGSPSSTYKFVYGNAFAVYALAEYARAFDDKAAVCLAQETVDKLDTHLYDAQSLGYYETADADWQRTPNRRGMNRFSEEEKTMNTHLHLIEAYTNLLRAAPSSTLRSRVRELLYLFLNKITDRQTHHFYYFQRRDWTPTTPVQSFGHDIEGSWLLYETAEALCEPEAVRAARDVCVNIARAVCDMGFHESGALASEYDPSTRTYLYTHFSWWEQAEAVVGCLNAWQLTREGSFLDRAAQSIAYIDNTFVDRKLGGWHARVGMDGTPDPSPDKANGFICPYHNARMSLEIMERIERIAKHNG